MNQKQVFRVLRQAFVLQKYSLMESLSRPKDFFIDNLGMVLFSGVFILPGILIRDQATMPFSMGLMAGWINIFAVSAFSNIIIGKLRSGEFESYLMVPVSLISLYVSNSLALTGMIPIILVFVSFLFLETGQLGLNVGLFLVALLLTYIGNCGISIMFGSIHMGYRPVSQLMNLVTIVVLLSCGIIVPGNIIPRPFDTLALLIPWVQSSLFFGYASGELRGIEFYPLYSAAYLVLFGIVSLVIALFIFNRAERRMRARGMSEFEY